MGEENRFPKAVTLGHAYAHTLTHTHKHTQINVIKLLLSKKEGEKES